MLDSLAGPFPNVSFLPSGGIGVHNIAEYMRRPYVLACGGSWMVSSALVREGRWDDISSSCAQAISAAHGFSFAHMAINPTDQAPAASIAGILGTFLQPLAEGPSSIFAGPSIEILKNPSRGTHGHIDMRTWDIDRALLFLKRNGFTADMSTARHNEAGILTFMYLEQEAGGFALHLIRA